MLLHLSDLHFGTENVACMQAVQQLCASMRPEAVVVSGDLTQRARYAQFYACKHFLDSLNLPYLVVPGNHDIPLYHLWNRFFSPFARYQLFFGRMETILETAHFYVIGVNSIRRRFHTRGHISLNQIQEIDALLQAAPSNKLKILVAHQPFYTQLDNLQGIKDCPVLGRIALEQWSKNGLHALLHGHLHQPAVYDLNQIYALGAAHPVLDIHAGTAISQRLHQGMPNSLNIVCNNGDVQHYIFDVEQKQFVLWPQNTE